MGGGERKGGGREGAKRAFTSRNARSTNGSKFATRVIAMNKRVKRIWSETRRDWGPDAVKGNCNGGRGGGEEKGEVKERKEGYGGDRFRRKEGEGEGKARKGNEI